MEDEEFEIKYPSVILVVGLLLLLGLILLVATKEKPKSYKKGYINLLCVDDEVVTKDLEKVGIKCKKN